MRRGTGALHTLALVVGVGASACARPSVDLGDNTILRGNFDFVPEHWQEPRLAELRAQEKLEQFVREDPFDTLLELVAWTHRQWPHSKPRPTPPDNALDILREIRAGRTGGWCGQYSFVLVDVAKALGFFCARYVEVESASGNAHFLSEVWSDSHSKWVALDADFGAYVRRGADGLPASALDVRDAVVGDARVEPVAVQGGPLGVTGGGHTDPVEYTGLFHRVAVSLRSDLLRSAKPSSVKERQRSYLAFDDGRGRGPGVAANPFANVTSRRADVEFDCNKVRVEWRALPRGRVELRLFSDGATPNFRRFMRARGGENESLTAPSEGWEPCEDRLVLDRRDGDQVLWLAPENQLGRRGVPHRVAVTW